MHGVDFAVHLGRRGGSLFSAGGVRLGDVIDLGHRR
jgi:hypothetical protein